MTTADHARAYAAAHPDAGPSEIARALTEQLGREVPRNAVAAALRRTSKRGRPRKRKRCSECGRPIDG